VAEGGAQRVHAVLPREGVAQVRQPGERGDAGRAELRAQGLPPLRVRRAAVPEQVAGVLERHPAGQVLDVVAGDDQPALLAVHVAERGLGDDDPIEPGDLLVPVHDRSSCAAA
jgi:hypothetical protein